MAYATSHNEIEKDHIIIGWPYLNGTFSFVFDYFDNFYLFLIYDSLSILLAFFISSFISFISLNLLVEEDGEEERLQMW